MKRCVLFFASASVWHSVNEREHYWDWFSPWCSVRTCLLLLDGSIVMVIDVIGTRSMTSRAPPNTVTYGTVAWVWWMIIADSVRVAPAWVLPLESFHNSFIDSFVSQYLCILYPRILIFLLFNGQPIVPRRHCRPLVPRSVKSQWWVQRPRCAQATLLGGLIFLAIDVIGRRSMSCQAAPTVVTPHRWTAAWAW